MRHYTGQWPKQLPQLTEEQKRISDDFMNVWLSELPKRFGIVEIFNHRYPLRSLKEISAPIRTLDIGAGRGTHLTFEDLDRQEYTALELRPELAKHIQEKFPSVNVVVGDIQDRLDFPDGTFNRILAIHVLEHLPNLPNALDEIKRLLSSDGRLSVLIPCDPGFAYEMARNMSARRIFEKRYQQSYDWYVASEHINSPKEIMTEIEKRFEVTHRLYFPLLIPVIPTNLIIGLTLKHRTSPEN
ncbi:MAG TPA: class I SAM-dependent methyltransferase [Oceanobacillus sp.]|nr:class I SAM-dependent methyltransferase [Oceanobacillus sp.]